MATWKKQGNIAPINLRFLAKNEADNDYDIHTWHNPQICESKCK